MSVFKINALSTCLPFWRGVSNVASDGDEGPDDGANHVHPETVFHADFRVDHFLKLHHH